MVSIEHRQYDWVVVYGTEVVSLHPTRDEAERSALWLARHEGLGLAADATAANDNVAANTAPVS